uniref:RNA helicase n=1 Tax=Opuntia streptacantha TaxID=393608 RepID=A0A7C9ARM5_OPUST
MEDTSFLFAGIKFDRKKFAKDFERFKEKKEKDLGLKVSFVENAKSEQEEGNKFSKKRKRKGLTGGSVEGFSVFKSSNPTSEIEQNDIAEDESSEKEVFRQLERDNILRKKYGIHISGSNVPSPLQSFDELKTKYKCKSYLLRNFAELGYVEPTPIQRDVNSLLVLLLDLAKLWHSCAPY